MEGLTASEPWQGSLNDTKQMKYTVAQYYVIIYLLLSSLSKKSCFLSSNPGQRLPSQEWMEYEKSFKASFIFFIFETDFVYYIDMFLKRGRIFVAFVRLAYPEIETLIYFHCFTCMHSRHDMAMTSVPPFEWHETLKYKQNNIAEGNTVILN